jgi:hypothetical protein
METNPVYTARIAQSAKQLAKGWTTKELELESQWVARILTSLCRGDRLCGPHSLLSNGYRGGKAAGCEADQSPPTSVEFKEMWIYTSTLPYVLIALLLITSAQRKLYLFIPSSVFTLMNWLHHSVGYYKSGPVM